MQSSPNIHEGLETAIYIGGSERKVIGARFWPAFRNVLQHFELRTMIEAEAKRRDRPGQGRHGAEPPSQQAAAEGKYPR